LRGVGIDSSVTEVMRRNPLVVHQREARTAAMNLIRDYKLVGVPIVDDDRRIVGLELIEELIGPPTSDNWVVLMAGGLGARLRPLTESVPKPMLPIGGRPILETIMRNFSAQGFRRFFVSVNYRREMIQSHFGDGREFGVEISYLVEEKPLGTAGSLCLLPERPSKPLIVMNGDLLAALPFHDVMRFHEHHCADATVCVMPYITEIPFGVVTFAAERMTGIEEKPKHQCMVNAGIYVLGPVAFDYLQHGERNDMTSVLERLIKAGRNVCVFRLQKSWVDIGRLDDLQRAEDEFSMLAPGLTID
jgi:NDP-sugar pyrophosphorylase family protein